MASSLKSKAREVLRRTLVYSLERVHFRGEIPLPRVPKVSFCTNCMNRLHHLRANYLQNLRDNADYPNVEFVLLNYDSKDGMDAWVREALAAEIASGRVTYYHAEGIAHYHSAHAKNVTHRLATGDIVCNLDADNFTGEDFAAFLAEAFLAGGRRVVHGHWTIQPGTTGRIAVERRHFMWVGGYDERMHGWSMDDEDFIARLTLLDFESQIFRDPRFYKIIDHDGDERVRNMPAGHQDAAASQAGNRALSRRSLRFFRYRANAGVRWGAARVRKNFGEEIMET